MHRNTWRTALLATLAAGCAWGQTAPKQEYTIKAEARTGTHIRKRIAIGHLPFDATYEQLSPAQQASLRKAYEAMPEQDEPPYPEGGMGALVKPISIAQQKLMVRGRLDMDLMVASDGNVSRVEVYKSPSPEMTRLLAQVAMQTRFKPARCGGQACAMAFPAWIEFRVEQ